MKKVALVIIGVVVITGGVATALLLSNGTDDSKGRSANSSAADSNEVKDKEQLSDGQALPEAVEANTVEIEDFAYQPAKITVKKGTTVTWINRDATRHDVSPDMKSDGFMGSRLLSKGETYSFTFDTIGVYTYHCSPHPYMKGTVEVVE